MKGKIEKPKKNRSRKVYRNAYQHIYQRAKDKGVIFYHIEDYLVLLSIISTTAKAYDVCIIAICFMINHFHLLISETAKKTLGLFVDIYTGSFAKEYNKEYRRKGALIQKRFGSANKSNEKAIRNCVIYINNNPSEKRIAKRVENYRWNFLAYLKEDFPFSKEIDPRKKSVKMQKALSIIDTLVSENQALKYRYLRTIFKDFPEDSNERNYLIDYIIKAYLPINSRELYKLYPNYEELITALYASTGTEYDIKEERDDIPDTIYSTLASLCEKFGIPAKELGHFYNMEKFKLQALAEYLFLNSSAEKEQIARFLHFDEF